MTEACSCSLSRMVKLSLLLPTRGRSEFVCEFLQSVISNACDPQCLEVVMNIDQDDSDSQAITGFPPLQIVKVVDSPGRPMGLMNQQCYEASSGRYVMLVNDDAVCRTNGWDTLIYKAFSMFSDDIALVYGNDCDQGPHVPTFPILSRAACKAMGAICPVGYLNLHIESHIFDVFKQLKRFSHDRIVYLPELVFEHLHHTLNKSVADQTSKKRDPRSDEWLFIALDDDRYRVANHLAHIIEDIGAGGASSIA